MFNLEQAIVEWRRQMRAAGIKTPVPLEELESHLREEVEQQTESGTNEERAFNLAAERIGKGEKLREEFGKIEVDARTRKRLFWQRWSMLAAGVAGACSTVFVTLFLARRTGRIEISAAEFLLVLGSLAATISFGLVGRRFARFLPTILDKRLQAAALVGAFFLGACWLRLICDLIFLTLDNIVHDEIVLLWTMMPLLGFAHCLFEWCVRCDAARRQAGIANS